MITIEDPVEYQLDSINQMPVNPKRGLTFATGLRHILRHDPDIVMVGEIRDSNTAKAIVQAALTGHKVFTTFHTETAIGALIRLHEMGIEDYPINETVELIIAQRLVRKACNRCKEEYIPDEDILEALELSQDNCKGKAVVRGSGRVGDDRCPVCHGTGYKGQIAIHEVLFVNADVAHALEKSKTSWEIQEAAKRRAGLITLKEDAVCKVMKGETTFEEIMRILPDLAEEIRPVEQISELCDSAADLSACGHSVAEWGTEALRAIVTSDNDNEQPVDEEKRTGKALADSGLKLKKVFSTKLDSGEQALSGKEFQTLMKVWRETSKHCEGPMEDNPRCKECKAVGIKAAAALSEARCDNCDLVVATDERSAYLLLRDPASKDSSWKIIASMPLG